MGFISFKPGKLKHLEQHIRDTLSDKYLGDKRKLQRNSFCSMLTAVQQNPTHFLLIKNTANDSVYVPASQRISYMQNKEARHEEQEELSEEANIRTNNQNFT